MLIWIVLELRVEENDEPRVGESIRKTDIGCGQGGYVYLSSYSKKVCSSG